VKIVEKDWFALSWKLLLTRGIIGILFGIVAMVWPISTAIALALLWGVWALIDGVGTVIQAFQPEAHGRVWLVLMGIVSLIAAFFAIFSPAVAAVALTWILGIWLIVRGVFELLGAFRATRQSPRWLLIVGGALSILLGVLFAANPGASAVGIAFWLGVTALIWGAAFVVLGVIVRTRGSHAVTTRSTPRAMPGSPA
jgi:uncharacterized membrane protein HdeD (DUF308 family)